MTLLIETIKIVDSVPQNMEYHMRRVAESTLALFGRAQQFSFEVLGDKAFGMGVRKMTIEYSRDRIIDIRFVDYVPRQISSLQLVEATGISYEHKYADRTAIEALRDNRRGQCSDILMYDDRGRILDVSYANVVFENEDGFFTPSSCLLPGTRRAILLDSGVIRTAEIGIDDLKNYKRLYLINAMLGLEDGVCVDVSNIRQ